MIISEAQLQYLVELGHQYNNKSSDSSVNVNANVNVSDQVQNKERALLCYDTALRLAWKNWRADGNIASDDIDSSEDILNILDSTLNLSGTGTPSIEIPLHFAAILNYKGIIQLQLLKYRESYRSFHLTLQIKRQHFHQSHADVCGTLHNLGLALQHGRSYTESYDAYSECIRLKQCNWVDCAIHIAGTIINLGMVCHMLHRRIEALRLLNDGVRTALRFYQESVEYSYENGRELVRGLHYLGDVYGEGAEYSLALQCFTNALAISKQSRYAIMAKEHEHDIEPIIKVLRNCIANIALQMNAPDSDAVDNESYTDSDSDSDSDSSSYSYNSGYEEKCNSDESDGTNLCDDININEVEYIKLTYMVPEHNIDNSGANDGNRNGYKEKHNFDESVLTKVSDDICSNEGEDLLISCIVSRPHAKESDASDCDRSVYEENHHCEKYEATQLYDGSNNNQVEDSQTSNIVSRQKIDELSCNRRDYFYLEQQFQQHSSAGIQKKWISRDIYCDGDIREYCCDNEDAACVNSIEKIKPPIFPLQSAQSARDIVEYCTEIPISPTPNLTEAKVIQNYGNNYSPRIENNDHDNISDQFVIYLSVMEVSIFNLICTEYPKSHNALEPLLAVRRGFVTLKSLTMITSLQDNKHAKCTDRFQQFSLLDEDLIVEAIEVRLSSCDHLESLLRFFFQCHDPTLPMTAKETYKQISDLKLLRSYIMFQTIDNHLLKVVESCVEDIQRHLNLGHLQKYYKGRSLYCALGMVNRFNEAHFSLSYDDHGENRVLFKQWPALGCSVLIDDRGINGIVVSDTESIADNNYDTKNEVGYQVVM